jgi:flagellar biosynthesis chaperone FliJ
MRIISLLSVYTSAEYQTTQGFISTLEETIRNSLTETFLSSLDVSLTITVLIESLIVDGVESNIEQINDRIEQVQGQLERAEKEKIQLSNFVQQIS